MAVSHHSIVDRPPPHGLLFQVKLTADDGPITRIHRLKGSFKILTGDPETITLPYFPKAKDLKLDNPLCEELGVTMFANPASAKSNVFAVFSHGAAYYLSVANAPEKILDVVATDTKGQTLEGGHPNWHTFSGPFLYTFTPRSPYPEDSQLRIAVLKNLHEVRVPFDLSDLTVPPFEKNLEQRRANFDDLKRSEP